MLTTEIMPATSIVVRDDPTDAKADLNILVYRSRGAFGMGPGICATSRGGALSLIIYKYVGCRGLGGKIQPA